MGSVFRGRWRRRLQHTASDHSGTDGESGHYHQRADIERVGDGD
jgi:hypothetical protein